MSFDLKKIILNVLEEGFMEVPKKVMQPIIDYYFEKLREFNRLGKQKVSKEFGTKTFELDFTGTGYEYLNRPNPRKIYVTLSNGYQSYAMSTGKVMLDFSEPERALTEVLEHEILHIIQMETGKDISKNPRYEQKAKDKGFDKSEYHAGLPKRKHIKRSQYPNPTFHGTQRTLYKITKGDPTSYYGFKPVTKNNKPYGYSKKRVEHSSRPIELYTDLLSTIRNLQLAFQKEISDLSISPKEKEKLKNSVPLRKKYYSVFIKDKNFNDIRVVAWVVNGEEIRLKVHTPYVGSDIWEKFKKNLPEKLYNDFLRLSYDAFVNREAPFDYEEIVKRVRELDTAKKEGEKERTEKEQKRKEKGVVDLKFYTRFGSETYPDSRLAKRNYDSDYFFPNTDDIDKNFYDKFFRGNRGEASEEILYYRFGAKRIEKKDEYWMVLPSSRSKIIKGFQDLKKARDEFYWFEELDNEKDKNKIKLFYDKLKEKLKMTYVSALLNQEQKGYLENMIDSAYGK
jgi:hypothetical protein